MEKIVLDVEVRKDFGKSGSRHVRAKGFIPGVVYREGKQGVNIQVDSKALWHALHTDAGENAIITMNISDGDKPMQKNVILKEIQTDPLNDKFVHVDFHEISLKEKLKVNVPIHVKGEAVGVKEEEGVLAQVMWEIEVECLPTAIPEHLDVQVDDLSIGDAIHVKELQVSEGVKIMEDPEQVVVVVNAPKAEEEAEAEVEEGAEAEEGAEPEVIKKGKKEEEASEEGAQEEAPQE